MTKFGRLFEPINMGKVEVRNRIVMPGYCTRLATPDGVVTKREIDHAVERAKGGVGLVIVGHCYIDTDASKAQHCQLGAYSDRLIPGLSELAEDVKMYDAKVILQLNHGGRNSNPAVIGRTPVAPSAVPNKLTGVIPKELTVEEIKRIVEAFGEAAQRAKAAGFDGVQFVGCAGYLLDSFFSPLTNKRTDKYGGDFEGRARFPIEAVKKVRQKVDSDFPIGYKLNADDYIDGGVTLDEAKMLAELLEKSGVDFIEVKGAALEKGSIEYNIASLYIPRGHQMHLAERVKQAVKIPVMAAGSINLPIAEKILEEGKADMVAMARDLIADPYLPRKAAENRVEDVCPCIRCNDCFQRYLEAKIARCSVNASEGREEEYGIRHADKEKSVLVVGGGPAGMEAARVAALRGHEVTLFEKEDKLGGHLVEASVPQFKEDLRTLMNWFLTQLEKVNINFKLRTEVTPEQIRKINPDALIIATGSTAIIPDIPGIDKTIVATASDVLLGKREVGEKVVVVGGGLIGCETALHLSEINKTVTIVEMLDEIAVDVEPYLTKPALQARLKKAGCNVLTGMSLSKITDDGIIGFDKRNTRLIKADNTVLALGLKSRQIAKFKEIVSEVYAIGDCIEPRKIMQAIHEGSHVARQI